MLVKLQKQYVKADCIDSTDILAINNLRCEFLCDPLSLESKNPRLSWMISSSRLGIKQDVSQVQVFASELFEQKVNRLLWDSGPIAGNDSWMIYTGPTLPIGEPVLWRVKIKCGRLESEWSAFATWEWGPIFERDWSNAMWIGAKYTSRPYPAVVLRREFYLEAGIIRARLYYSGLGCSEVYLNGTKIGDALIDPAQSDYEHFAYYRVHDVTSFLRKDDNTIDVMLGDGWYNQDRTWTGKIYAGGVSYGKPGLKLLLQVTDKNGEISKFISDEQWNYNLEGPIRSNNIFAGECYDARRDLINPTDCTVAIQEWKAVENSVVPTPKLAPQLIPPIRKKEIISPISLHSPLCGVWVYDFGQNIAGNCSLKVSLPRGTELCLRYAEAISPDGNIDPLSTGYIYTQVIQTDRYTCRGDEEEIWEPSFTYHGFRYVELTGYPGKPALSNLNAITVHSDLESVGNFTCSDPFINKLQDTALRTIKSNLHGVMTDCPTRERCGWLGDSHLVAEAIIYNFDAANFFRKYQRDILNSLGKSNNTCGGYPADKRVPTNIAPGKRRCQQGRPDWAAALILIPWYLYIYYGDTQIVRSSFPAMHDLMDYWSEVAKDGILEDGFGDWCPPGSTGQSTTCPTALSSTAYWFAMARCMSRFSHLLGHTQEVKYYTQLQRSIRSTFLKHFYNSTVGDFGSQTGNVLALAFEIVPRNQRYAVAQRLAKRINEIDDGHFDTGIFGLRYIFDVLAKYGQSQTCIRLLHQKGFPSFKHLFSLGATTFWETMYDPEEFALGAERSKNHPMQAAFAAWHFQGLGGLRPDPNRPGFEHFFLSPQLVGILNYNRIAYSSIRGMIISEWNVHNGMFQWDIEIPSNSSVTLGFPERILPNSVHLIGEKTSSPICFSNLHQLQSEYGSGCYRFEGRLQSD